MVQINFNSTLSTVFELGWKLEIRSRI